jgi:two-component system nitrate/nitrite response regulator NarL
MSPGANETRIMVVDDHVSFRQPLAFMLDREPDLVVVAQAGSVAEAREVLEDAGVTVDLVLVDLDLPDGSGWEFIAELQVSSSQALALVLSAHSDPVRLARAIDAGAAGILHKSSYPEDIVDAVHRLCSGEQLIAPQEVIEAVRLVSRERLRDHETQVLISKLTPRERELLEALAEGLSDKEMAEKLYVGIGTIRSHMTHLLSKLGVNSRLQALVFAIRYGLVEVRRPLRNPTES